MARAEATKKADNLYSAKKCITGHSPLPQKANAVFRDCELVKSDLLTEEIKPDFTQALAKNEAFKAVQAAEQKLMRRRGGSGKQHEPKMLPRQRLLQKPNSRLKAGTSTKTGSSSPIAAISFALVPPVTGIPTTRGDTWFGARNEPAGISTRN